MTKPKMLEPVLVTPPAGPVVYLTELKTHVYQDFGDDDGLIAGLIQAATEYVDGYNGMLGRALITQTWRADFDMFPGSRRIGLPLGPVQSVTLNYFDSDNVQQTLASANYAAHEDECGPFLWLDEGQDAWPDTYDRRDAVQITTVVGYGDDPADVPEPVRLAIGHIAVRWYRHREPEHVGGELRQIPAMAEALLNNYKRMAF